MYCTLHFENDCNNDIRTALIATQFRPCFSLLYGDLEQGGKRRGLGSPPSKESKAAYSGKLLLPLLAGNTML